MTDNNNMQANKKIINTSKTLKGSYIKTYRSKQKIDRQYTEVIFEDEYLFHNIKVEGQCLQIADHHDHKDKQLKVPDQENPKQNILISRTPNQLALANKTIKSIENSFMNPSPGFVRSITSDTAIIFHKSQAQAKSNRKFTRTETAMNTSDYPRISYKEQNLNEQIYCNFKNILDEFKKVKGKPKVSIEQKIKDENKSCRKTYKKPNFYNYQQFYRQNYQARNVKQPSFLFKKVEYSSITPMNSSGQKFDKKQSLHDQISKKPQKVCVCIDSTKMAILSKKSTQAHNQFGVIYPISCAARRQNKTELCRGRKQRKNTTKTSNFILDSPKQGEGIEPWNAHDQFETGF